RKSGMLCTAQDHGCRAVRACTGWTCSSTARVRSCDSSWIEQGLEGDRHLKHYLTMRCRKNSEKSIEEEDSMEGSRKIKREPSSPLQ
ncbi:hypothetical protein ACJX0J_018377, partial [Zea mays]